MDSKVEEKKMKDNVAGEDTDWLTVVASEEKEVESGALVVVEKCSYLMTNNRREMSPAVSKKGPTKIQRRRKFLLIEFEAQN